MSSETRTLTIDGMHCEHCVAAVEDALSELDGVSVHGVEIGEAEITYDTGRISENQIAAAVDEAGYEVQA